MDTGQQASLGELSQAALMGVSLTALLRQTVLLVARQLRVDYSAIWERLPDRHTLLLRAATDGQDAAPGQHPITADRRSFAGHVLSSRAPVMIVDWSSETRIGPPPLLRERTVCSSLGVVIPTAPLFGVLTADSTTPRTFADPELSLLQTVASVLALAIDHIQVNETLEQRVAKRTRAIERDRQVAAGLHAIMTILNSHQTLDNILGYIIAQACRLLDPAAGAIYRLHSAEALLHIEASSGLDAAAAVRDLPVDENAMGQAVRTGQPVAIPDTAAYLVDHGDQGLGGLLNRYPALLTVPVMVKSEVYGAMTLYYEAPRIFSPDEIRLAVAFTDQAALAIENARLVAASQETAVLEERQRLARDLHDSVTQAVYSIGLQAQAASRLLVAGDTLTTALYLQEMQDAAQEALEELRLLIFELRPAVLEEAGLPAALQTRLGAVEGRSRLTTRLVVEGVDRLPAAVEQTLYRIAQEALNNALKHAHARSLTVLLQQTPSQVILEIADDGRGFDPATAGAAGGLGLRGIAERTAQLGGQLVIDSRPGVGTTLRVEVPL